MAKHRQVETAEPSAESGFMLIAVVVMVALVLIALSVAAPVVARQLRRDKEIESQHRMNDYVRAIQLFQRKFPGQYPPSIKALENTNNIRFLRKQWIDPLTGKADYKLIHLGEQQTKIHVFFGQDLEKLTGRLGGMGGLSSGGIGGAAPTGTNNCIGATSGLAAGFGGACQTSTSGASGSTGASGASGTSGATGSSGSPFGSGTVGLIVGVGTSRSGSSVTEPNGQSTYETWEFWYDPRIELLKQGVSLTGGLSSTDAGALGKGISGLGGASGTTGASGPTGSTSMPTGPGGFGSSGP